MQILSWYYFMTTILSWSYTKVAWKYTFYPMQNCFTKLEWLPNMHLEKEALQTIKKIVYILCIAKLTST